MLAFAKSLAVVAVAVMSVSAVPAQGGAAIRADEAVRRSIERPASALAPTWIWMDVCGSGEHRGRGYLNSMQDYRRRESLNVELTSEIRAALAERFSGDPVEVLHGRQIAVYGAARQVRIDLLQDGIPTGQFYFQTQLRLASPEHLELVVGDDGPVSAQCGDLLG